MKEHIKNGFLYFIYVLAAEYIGFLIALITIGIVRLFAAELDSPVSFFTGNIGATIAITVLCRNGGYKDAVEGYKFSLKYTIPFIIGLLCYILLNVIFDYQNPSGLNAMFLTELLVGTTEYSLGELREGYGLFLFLGIAICTLIKYPFMVLGYKKGIKKREVDRNKLHTQK